MAMNSEAMVSMLVSMRAQIDAMLHLLTEEPTESEAVPEIACPACGSADVVNVKSRSGPVKLCSDCSCNFRWPSGEVI